MEKKIEIVILKSPAGDLTTEKKKGKEIISALIVEENYICTLIIEAFCNLEIILTF